MGKIIKFNIVTILFLTIAGASISKAEEANPFTVKGASEFTKQDRERFEEQIRTDFDGKIYSLEVKLNKEIEELKKRPVAAAPRTTTRTSSRTSSGDNTPDFGVDEFDDPNSESAQNAAISSKIRNASLIGCIDEQALFKNNKTKEKFFVPLKEVENNEEFNKIGGCGF